MTDYYFLLNLRNETLSPKLLKPLSQNGFLISPKYAKGRILETVQQLRNAGAIVLADNGNFSSLDDITSKFEERSNVIVDEITKTEKKLGHRVRNGDLNDSLLTECTTLALEVQKASEQITVHGSDPLESQINSFPSHLIGAEDLTVAALVKLNIEPSYLNLGREFFKNLNLSVIQRAANHMERIPRELQYNYYPVASAMSYDNAYDAGEVFAKSGIEKIAMGFGAYLCDRRKTDFVDFAGKRIEFEERLPNSYVRAGVVAKGFWEGYTNTRGKAPEAFHFLGLGVPIMLGISALFAWGTSTVTFDATSPIKDAFSGTVYIYKPSFLKAKNTRLCTKLAKGVIAEWDCPCPFCREFIQKYPFDYVKGTQWFQDNQREVNDDDLDSGSLISQAYPLFAKLDNNTLGKEIRLARIGHNHWVLNKIMEELSNNSRDLNSLRTYIGNVVENYEKEAISSDFARAINFLYQNAHADK